MEPRKKRNAGIPKRYQGEMVLDDATFKSLIISQKNCNAPNNHVGLDDKNGVIKHEYLLANGPTLEAVTAPNIECIALGPTQFEIRFAEIPTPPPKPQALPPKPQVPALPPKPQALPPKPQSLPKWPKELDGVSQVLPCYVRLDRSEVTRYLLQQEEKKEIVLNSSGSSRKRQVSCQRCNRTFTSRIQLKKHRCKRSAAPALCHFCDTSFVKTEDLIQHLLSCALFITPEPSPVNGDDAELYPEPNEIAPCEPLPSCGVASSELRPSRESAPFKPPPPCELNEPPLFCEFCLKTLHSAAEKFVHYDLCIPYHETRLLELRPRIQKTRKLVKTKFKRRKMKVPAQQNEVSAEEIDDESCVRVHQPSPVKAARVTEDFYQSELRKAVESIASLEHSDGEEILPSYVLPGKRYLEITVMDVDEQLEEESVRKSSLSLANISDPGVVVVECAPESEESVPCRLESPTSTTADTPPFRERRIVSVAIKKSPKLTKTVNGTVSSSSSDTIDAPESANLPHLSREVLRLCNKCCQHKDKCTCAPLTRKKEKVVNLTKKCCQHKHKCTCVPVLRKKEKLVNLTLVKTKEKSSNKKILSAKKKVSVLDLIKPSRTSKSKAGVPNQQIFRKYKEKMK